MPIAKALRMDTSTARRATDPEIQIEFHNFSGKLTRSQKLTMPSR
jgi:hypothetical protein